MLFSFFFHLNMLYLKVIKVKVNFQERLSWCTHIVELIISSCTCKRIAYWSLHSIRCTIIVDAQVTISCWQNAGIVVHVPIEWTVWLVEVYPGKNKIIVRMFIIIINFFFLLLNVRLCFFWEHFIINYIAL